MFFLGVLAVLQVCFLPGLLIVRIFKNLSFLQKVILAFASSLLFNFYFVWFCTLLGIYNRPVCLGLIAAEIIALFAFWKPWESKSLAVFWPSLNPQVGPKSRVFYWLCILCIGAALFVIAERFSYVFLHSDAILSFNRWALDWYSGQIPKLSWHYPQVVPAAWSFVYQCLGRTDVQIFSHAVMPLFPMMALLGYIDLSFHARKAKLYLLAGALFIGFIAFDLVIFDRNFWFGTADLAAACLGWMSLSIFLKGLKNKEEVVAASLCLVAACLTKQSGLFLLAAYPLLWFAEHKRNNYRFLLKAGLLCILLISPWYLFKQYHIWVGSDLSEVQKVTVELFRGATFFQRIEFALVRLVNISGGVFGLVMVVLLATLGSVRHSEKFIAAFFVVPYFLIWAVFFSYDRRNLLFIFPALCILVSGGLLFFFFSRLDLHLNKIRSHVSRNAVILGAAGVTILLAVSPALNLDVFLERQSYLQRSIGSPRINEKIYALRKEHPDAHILTNYYVLKFLPDLQASFIPMRESEFIQQLKSDLKADYLLIDERVLGEQGDEMRKLPGVDLEWLWTEEKFYLYKVIRKTE